MIFSFLHNYLPSPVLTTVGPLTIYWYGTLYLVAIVLGYLLVDARLKKRTEPFAATLRQNLIDVAFGLIVWGLIGARLYHVLNDPLFYWQAPLQIFEVWKGGLAIHGALIAGALYLLWYARRQHVSFLWLADVMAPAVLLGQAIGRFGNYFNQELFGYPTNLPWGIPIDEAHRPVAFASSAYFHPVFLYESLWDVAALVIILYIEKKQLLPRGGTLALYLILVGLGRFLVELIRIDDVPIIFSVRLPLIVALISVAIGTGLLVWVKKQYTI